MKIDNLKQSVQRLITISINTTLVSLISYLVGYGTDTAKFIIVLRNKRICRYQSKLLRKYLCNPKKYLTLEVDKLDFTVSYNRKAKKVFRAIKCESKGLLIVRPKLQHLIIVEGVRMDGINKTCHKKQNNRPHFTHKYEVRVIGKPKAVLTIHVADGSKSKYMGIRCSLNTNHFSKLELAAVFSHIHNTTGTTEYNRMIAKARVTRVDIAVNLPGVSSIFLWFLPPHGNSTRSTCLPQEDDCKCICETLYLGHLPKEDDDDRTRKSKYRIYCSHLNKLKNDCDLQADEYVVAARLEYELNCWDNQRGLLLTNMQNVLVKLDKVQLIDPVGFYKIPAKWHKELLVDKSIANIRRRLWFIKHRLNQNNGFSVLSLDGDWLKQEQKRALTILKEILVAPKSQSKETTNEA
jgi:hypothetical protein